MASLTQRVEPNFTGSLDVMHSPISHKREDSSEEKSNGGLIRSEGEFADSYDERIIQAPAKITYTSARLTTEVEFEGTLIGSSFPVSLWKSDWIGAEASTDVGISYAHPKDELITRLRILMDMQQSNIAYKRLARYAGAFMGFFSFAFLSRVFLQVTIVTPLWNNIGLLLSFGFLIMALAMRRDWKKHQKKQEADNL